MILVLPLLRQSIKFEYIIDTYDICYPTYLKRALCKLLHLSVILKTSRFLRYGVPVKEVLFSFITICL
jgi:hypothetical protein